MAKQHWKGSVLLAPVPPTLVTCGTMEKHNVLTVAWTGVLATHPPMTYISVRPSRYSYEIILAQREFVINLPISSMMQVTDFCGVRSGREVDKFQMCHLTPEPAQTVQAPLIAECPVNLECRVTATKELGTHVVFEAEITGVNVEEKFLDSKGKLNLQQCGLMAYAHGEYFALGRKLGNFGDSVRRKKKRK
jgi:flavin reductase (DIM6/NTAB) family NADH-FMN oxidoreductase RutF